MAAVADDVLLARVAAGDRAALDALFDRHRGVAYRVAFRLLGREADALDAVQDGFLHALRNVSRFRGNSSFRTWLLRVVSNAALDVGRTRGRHLRKSAPPLAEDDPAAAVVELVGADLDFAELRRTLDAALAALPAAQRQTFVLHVDGGLSYREVADALRVSIGTVMSRLFYARQRLKVSLAAHVTP